MIVAAYGFPGLSLLELSAMLNKLGVTYGAVRQGSLTKIKGRMERQSVYPVIFQNATLFLRTQKKFGKARVIALVLDNPYTLQHELGLTLAGAVFTKKSILFSQFTHQNLKDMLIACKDKTEPLSFTRTPYILTKEVLKDYSASSLSELQTFLYKIKDTDNREFVSKTVKRWMTTAHSFDVLEPKLKKYLQPKNIETLKKIMVTPNMKKFREAVRKVADKPTSLVTVAKRYKVNSFDIKYLLSTTS